MYQNCKKKNIEADNEYEIGLIVKSIENYMAYFAPVVKKCNISLHEIKSTITKDCGVVQKYSKDSDFYIMKINYIDSKTFFDMIYKSNNNKLIALCFDSYPYLVKSLNLLTQKQIVHFDLKENNIIYNTKTNTPIIIDFGLSINMKLLDLTSKKYSDSLSHYFYVYAPDYYVWTIEIHFINYLLHVNSKPTLEQVEVICRDVVNRNRLFLMFSDEFVENYTKKCVAFYSKFVGKKTDSVIKELLSYYHTWDQYSLSIIYLNMIRHIYGNNIFQNDLLIYFSQLLLKNIDPEPFKRNTVKQILDLHERIFNMGNTSVKNYRELVNKITVDANGALKEINKVTKQRELLRKMEKNKRVR